MAIKLVAFDGDDTLWTPMSGLNLSDRTPTDGLGNPDFNYRAVEGETLLVEREDGARFALRPEAADVLGALRDKQVLTGVISYNHVGNVERILQAFGIAEAFDYVIAEWHTGKDRMLARMLSLAVRDGHDVQPSETLLVDDDPAEIYGAQCSRMGACFTRFGVEIRDLRDLLIMLDSGPRQKGKVGY
jgi:magnesium-dependent phosphatase-1